MHALLKVYYDLQYELFPFHCECWKRRRAMETVAIVLDVLGSRHSPNGTDYRYVGFVPKVALIMNRLHHRAL